MNEIWLPSKSIHLPPPTKAELATTKVLSGLVEIGAWDKAGQLYHQVRELSHSPVKQFLHFVMSGWSRQTLSITDFTNTGRNIISSSEMDANGGFEGIRVGTNATTVDITDYFLAANIADGTASGEFIYQSSQFDADITVSDPDCTFDMWRNFTNNSGGSITVRETGIIVAWTGPFYFLAVRDTPTPVVVVDGGGCYVKYTLKITE